jgi:hypothetical protein
MHGKKKQVSNRVYISVVIGSLAMTLIIAGIFYRHGKNPEKAADTSARMQTAITAAIPVPAPPQIIDYNGLEKNTAMDDLLQKRKDRYGIDTGLDVIIQSDEKFKIGDTTLSMQKILEKIRLKHGDILEKTLDLAGMDAAPPEDGRTEIFGIYVVRPGDNIWNIHFNFLKDYLDHKNITVAPMADEPDKLGSSSGIGKLLKFSETMIHIYNIEERRLDVDLDLIQPLNKLVVYNMTQIFALLSQVDYTHVNHIRFDGETIWIPADQ